MENILKVFAASGIKVTRCHTRQYVPLLSQRCHSTTPHDRDENKKLPHPYRKIHPWKSLKAFTDSLIAGVVHNKDGLVAVNKPYGICGRSRKFEVWRATGIVNEVDYALDNAIPEIAKAFGYPDLKLIKCPERFTSGIAMLAANDKVEMAVQKALLRASSLRMIPWIYWIVTTKVPNNIQDEMRLAMRMQKDPVGNTQQPVIVTSWSHAEQKKGDVKILNVQFKVIGNSSGNLSSLIEIRSSTAKWHALRLFAATVLYSPILGDNIYGSRVKNVMGKWLNISPFVDAAREPPKLDGELLTQLKLSRNKEALIPAHVHLREIYLPMFNNKDSDLILTAPPMPEFTWTCQQLEFKHDLFHVEQPEDIRVDKDPGTKRYQAVT